MKLWDNRGVLIVGLEQDMSPHIWIASHKGFRDNDYRDCLSNFMIWMAAVMARVAICMAHPTIRELLSLLPLLM